ncbi:MAG: PAS domain S-box protein, partial [Bacteroidota bacterium]
MKRTTLDKLNYEAFFQVASYMFCIASEDGYFLEVNDAFTEVLGYSKNELISKPFVDFIHPDDISSTKEELGRLVSGGKSINFRNRYLAKDGSYKVLEWNTRPIGPDHMLYAIARDITPQIHNFQDLQEKYTKSKDEVNHSNNRIRSLYDHAPDMMGSVDPPSGKFIHVNHKMQEKTGYARTELFGMTWPKVLSSASKRKVGHLIQQFNETGRIINEKVIIQTKNGLHFPVELNTQAVKDGQGKVLYTTFVLRDISLRETNRINYERTNKRLQKIAELSPSIIYLFDIKKQKNIFSNRQLHEKLGYSDQDVSEQGEAFLPSIIHPDDWSKVIQH